MSSQRHPGRVGVGRRVTAALLLAVLVALGGCTAYESGEDPQEDVPEDVDAVATVDFDALEDDTTESVLNTLLEQTVPPGSDEPRTVDGLIEEAKAETNANVSVDGLNEVAVFTRVPETTVGVDGGDATGYTGVIVGASWDREDVVGDLRADADAFETGEYRNVTVYEAFNETTAETTYVAAYDEGLWAFATQRAVVEDVIDVAEGRADAFGGELRAGYDRTREDAYVRYAVELSEQQRRAVAVLAQRSSPVDVTALGDVGVYSGAYYTDRDEVGVSTYLAADDADAADRLNASVSTLVEAGRELAREEAVREQFAAVSTERDGRVLAVRYEIDADELESFLEQAGADPGTAPVSLPAPARALALGRTVATG